MEYGPAVVTGAWIPSGRLGTFVGIAWKKGIASRARMFGPCLVNRRRSVNGATTRTRRPVAAPFDDVRRADDVTEGIAAPEHSCGGSARG